MTLQLLPELEGSVRAAANEDGVSPDIFVARVLQQHLHRRSISVTESEAELLTQINLGLTAQEWRRLYQLRDGLENETLQADDQAELLRLTDRLESVNARRMAALIKLAVLRRTTLDALLEKFGLRPSANV
ncbi:MAG: hypothetical protein KJZ86_01600 [Caldilineaceae bacterium]|nr:hypothetical protein [Caldilineaceae bacterium]HRJ43883.1 hypothetical protein [Caldilineaceae bacterium]